MLLANRNVAAEFGRRRIPGLFRVHEDPNEDRLEILVKAVARLGYTIDQDNAGPQELQKLLGAVAGKPEAQLVNMLVLRSLKQAKYSSEDLGHFGLGFENYLHFTSPIRRYPDLVVHRNMHTLMLKRPRKGEKARIEERCRNWRSTPVNGSGLLRTPSGPDALLPRQVGAGPHRRDLHRPGGRRDQLRHVLALPNGVEGLLHVSNLDDDHYMFFEESLMLMGKHPQEVPLR